MIMRDTLCLDPPNPHASASPPPHTQSQGVCRGAGKGGGCCHGWVFGQAAFSSSLLLLPPSLPQATMTMGAGLFGASLGVFVKMASNSMRKIPLRRGKELELGCDVVEEGVVGGAEGERAKASRKQANDGEAHCCVPRRLAFGQRHGQLLEETKERSMRISRRRKKGLGGNGGRQALSAHSPLPFA